jgi:hypothetical protein
VRQQAECCVCLLCNKAAHIPLNILLLRVVVGVELALEAEVVVAVF